MMISNDVSFNGATAENYATTKSWLLTSGNGLKTVYVKFKDNAGNWSGVFSTIIQLDIPGPTVAANPPGGHICCAKRHPYLQ